MEKIIQSTVRFGNFKLSSGKESNHYFDLRKLFSDPNTLQEICESFSCPPTIEGKNKIHVCGVPYGAIPLATVYSLTHNISQLILRKEAKKHGTEQLIEGQWKPGDQVILIDDVWTTGRSMLNAYNILKEQGLKVIKMLVVLNRESGNTGKNYSKMLEWLYHEKDLLNKIDSTYRFKLHLHREGKLCLAADVNTFDEVLQVIKKFGDSISVLKLHPDLIDDWNIDTSIKIAKLRSLAENYNFLLWADIKLCEVPHIVQRQLTNYSWADLVSIMSIVGNDCLNELSKLAASLDIMLVIVPSLYTNGKLIWLDNSSNSSSINSFEFDKNNKIVASVGVQIPGLLYIKAGVGENEDLTKVDLVVRGRSLMQEDPLLVHQWS
jgi:uridine monophosphate synthetase